MISSKLFQVFSRVVPAEKVQTTLRAFKQNPILWNGLVAPEMLERVQQEWPQSGTELTPATLALFQFGPEMLQNGLNKFDPEADQLEAVMLDFENYLQDEQPVTDLARAARVALALYKKLQQNPEWGRLLREIAVRQNLRTEQDWLNYWGAPLAILAGKLENCDDLLQALLQIVQPEISFPLVRQVILSQPMEVAEQAGLCKNALAVLPLAAQVRALRQLRGAGDEELLRATAHGLFEREFVKEPEEKSVAEIWQNSENALQAANTDRDLAALAEFAGEYATAEKLLKAARAAFAAELAGTVLQGAALQAEQGQPMQGGKVELPAQVSDDPAVQDELAMLAVDSADVEANTALANLLGAEAILKAGNESVAKQMASDAVKELLKAGNMQSLDLNSARVLNWTPRRLLKELVDLGQWADARHLIVDLLQKSPTDRELQRLSLLIARAANDRNAAVSALETLCLLQPEDAETLRQLAGAYSDAAEWPEAYDSYATLVEQNNSEEADDWLGYAEAALKTDHSPVAIEFAQRALQTRPEDGRALAILGYAHHKQGESEKALEFLNRSVSAGPDSVEPWLLISELHRENGNMEKSIEVLQTARNTFPDSAELRLELAKELLDQGRAAEALSTLKDSTAGKMKDAETALLMIRAQKKLGLPDTAGLVTQAHEDFPENSELTYEYAALQLRQGDAKTCEALLEPLVKTSEAPTDWKLAFADAVVGEDYHNVHHTSLPENAEVQTAKSLLGAVLMNEPENIYAKVITAESAIKEGQTQKAFEFLTNLLKEAGSENSDWFDRIKAGFAWAATLLDKADTALNAIQSIVEAHPDWTAARQTLAEVDQAVGDISEAVDQANQVLEVAPDVAQSAEWFANFLSSLGKRAEAEDTLQTLSKTHKEKLPLLIKLGELKLQDGEPLKTKEVAESIRRALPRAKSDTEIVRAAKLFDQLGEDVATVNALKSRLASPVIPTGVAATDLAGYLRGKGRFVDALNVLADTEQKLGAQRWLTLLKAETLHAQGESDAAFAALNALPTSKQHLAAKEDLDFVPEIWQGLLEPNPDVGSLEQELAFESGNYQDVLDQATESEANLPMKIEADYAVGNGAQSLPWLESSAADERVYASALLAAEVAELLLDAGRVQTAGEILMRALERYPEDRALKLDACRQAAFSRDWPTAEALFLQESADFSRTERAITVNDVCALRILVKAAMAVNHWPETLEWSRYFAGQQNRNQTAQLTRLQALVNAIEFAQQMEGLGIEQHVLSAEVLKNAKIELAALLETAIMNKNPNFEHWYARGKAVLEPTQTNIRRLALFTPEADDLTAMMTALDRSGQNTTALQLGKKHEEKPEVLFASASILYRQGETQKALEQIEKISKRKAVLPWADALGAQINQKQGEYYAAIHQIEEGLENWPDEANWHQYAAEDWQAIGDTQNVTVHLEKALQLKPNDAAIQLQLGKIYLQAKEMQRAIDCLLAVSKKEVNQFEAWEALSEAYYQAGQNNEALAAAQRASSINAFSVKPYLLSAQISLDEGKSAQALEQAQKAVQQDANDAESQMILAKSWLAQGNKLQVLHALEKVPAAKNASIQLLIEHARMVKEINGAANARDMLAALSERYPDNTDVLNMLGEAQLASGDKAAAVKTVQHSLKLQEVQPQMQRFLGTLEFENGNLDQSIYHYSQAITQSPREVEPYLELSKVYIQQRDYDAAMQTLNQAIDLDRKDLRPLMAAATLMRNAKDYAKAEALLRRAAEIAPSDLNVRRQLGAVIALNLVESSQEASSHL